MSETLYRIFALTLLAINVSLLNAIGDNISPTQGTRQGHRLVTHGPYRWIRHPLYSVASIFAISMALLTSMWWLAAGLVAPMTVLLPRTRREEANLIREFGDEYRAYQGRTGRFIPFVY